MQDHIDYLKWRVGAGKMSRREFIGRASALGLTAALANTMYAGAVSYTHLTLPTICSV